MALELVSVPSRTHWPASGPPRTKIRLPAVIATSPEAEPTAMPPGRASVRPRTTRLVPARVRSPRSVVTARFPAASSVSRTAWPARATEAAPVPRTSAATASQRPASAVKLPSRVVMAALMAMSRAASSRRSPVPVQLSGTATVMSPGICASGGAEVVTVTSAPPLRAFSSAMRLTTSAPSGSGPPGPSAIRMSWGSSSQRVADTFAAAPIASATRPEVSTKPPAPRAESAPSTCVSPSDQATIRPPRAPPSAASSAPSSIPTAVARRRVPPPCASPPIRIEPPVVPPRAATLAAPATSTRAPVATMSPPSAAPEASSVPEILTRPLPRATSSIRPPLPVPASARMMPEVLIAASSACAAAPALSRTRSPSMWPLFVTLPRRRRRSGPGRRRRGRWCCGCRRRARPCRAGRR